MFSKRTGLVGVVILMVLAFVGTTLAAVVCPECKKESPDEAAFCMFCGQHLGEVTVVFEDDGSGSHLDRAYELDLSPGATVQSEQLDGSNFGRVLRKAGPDGMNIQKTVPTDLEGLHLKARAKFDFSWDSESSMAGGYAFGTMEIDFRASAQQGLVSYVYYAYQKHPFENSQLAGTPKSLDRIFSTQKNMGSARLPEGEWQELDLDLMDLLRSNFPNVAPQDVHAIKVTFAIQNWPQKLLEECNGTTTIDYVKLYRE